MSTDQRSHAVHVHVLANCASNLLHHPCCHGVPTHATPPTSAQGIANNAFFTTSKICGICAKKMSEYFCLARNIFLS